MSKTIKTEIDINASAARVWEIITDLERFSDWNPFVTDARGTVEQGGKIAITIASHGKKPMSFQPTIVDVVPEQRLAWLGKVGMSGIFDGKHQFEIVTTADQSVKFVHSEEFSGILAAVIGGRILKQYGPSFKAMNEALKARAESVAS